MEKPVIFIVDDEELTCRLLSKRLTEHGYETVTANNAKMMRRKMEKKYPDLILMDIVLPDMEGPEIVKNLQDDLHTRNIPVIFLSSIVDQEQGLLLPEITAGGRSFAALGKPINIELLVQKVRFALEQAKEGK
jgi:CheY-like chemotaxis protein